MLTRPHLIASQLSFIGRPPLAAPAVGVSSQHKAEQIAVIKAAFSGL